MKIFLKPKIFAKMATLNQNGMPVYTDRYVTCISFTEFLKSFDLKISISHFLETGCSVIHTRIYSFSIEGIYIV